MDMVGEDKWKFWHDRSEIWAITEMGNTVGITDSKELMIGFMSSIIFPMELD